MTRVGLAGIIDVMRKWPIGLMLAALACFGPKAQTSAARMAVPPPDWLTEEPLGQIPDAPNARYLGRFKVTYYWVVEEKDYPASREVPLYDTKGGLIGRFSSRFVRAFKIEAAARLRDGRCLTYLKQAGKAQVSNRFMGYGGHVLTELKSVAVDPRVVPLGARIYVPQAEEVMVNGRPHSGVFYAHDIGSAVRGKHIDIFLGPKKNAKAFASAGIRSLGSVDVYILE